MSEPSGDAAGDPAMGLAEIAFAQRLVGHVALAGCVADVIRALRKDGKRSLQETRAWRKCLRPLAPRRPPSGPVLLRRETPSPVAVTS
eukprot:4320743-Pyramimonas_sp.AAC.1